MEKFGNKSKSKPCNRLLSIFFINFLFLTSLAAQNHRSNYDYKTDEIPAKNPIFEFTAAENQNFFENENLDFFVDVPQIKPSQIELKSYNFPQNVQLKMLRKTENYKNGGTTIDLWLNFEKNGVYKLENFVFSAKNRKDNVEIKVNFPEITIKKDISKESPKIVIVFENGKTIYHDNNADFPQSQKIQEQKEIVFKINEGEKLNFTVCAQFSKEILSFEYEIPKNAIFKQTEFFDYKNPPQKKSDEFLFSEELQPLARFELTGLTSGIEEFPVFLLQTKNFQDENEEIKFLGFYIEFLENSEQKIAAEKNIYGEAFVQITETENQNKIEKNKLSYEECKKIAQKLKSKRIKKMILIFLPIFAFVLILFFIFLRKNLSKKIILIIFLFIFLIFAFTFFVLCSKNESGIFLGGKIYAIPDENSTVQTEYPAGKKIKLLEKTENWLYIQTEEEIFGWCRRENTVI